MQVSLLQYIRCHELEICINAIQFNEKRNICKFGFKLYAVPKEHLI